MLKSNGGVFGRNPTFNNVTATNLSLTGSLTINGNVITGLDYNGAWNASTNSPALASSVGQTGAFYIVSVAGSTNLNGVTSWTVGDWVIFDGSAWQRIEGGQVDLTNGVTGILPAANGGTGNGFTEFTGPASSKKTITLPNANATMARTDAAQSFTGDQTLATGNLVVGTAGTGVDFSANTNAAGMTGELLNWYEEGTWTPTLQGGTTAGSYTLGSISAYYTRIGRQVTVNARFDVTVNSAGTGTAKFGGLPFSKGSSQYATGAVYTSAVTYAANIISLAIQSWSSSSSTDFAIAGVRSGTTPSDLDITGISTGSIFYLTFTYFV